MIHLQEKEKHQDEQIGRLKEEVATATKLIADLTAGWNTSVSGAYDVVVYIRKVVADNLVPKPSDVDELEFNRILKQVDMRAVNLFNSALLAGETLTEFQDSPCPYSPDPAKDEDIPIFSLEDTDISSEDDV